ncbi:MAG: ECF transporter S component [Candidatus Bathyarchaeia archaeon]|jgi:energy-coupling factor transport system substrate-specific component
MHSKTWRQPATLIIVATAVNAALYAVGSLTTAYIPSPWGIGQFRPAVVIPSFFATIFGPWAGGLGAALGTLIADSIKHGGIYPGSLLSAVPGNFIGFFIMGYFLRKKFTWSRFITWTNISLLIANSLVAFLYVYMYKFLYAQTATFISASNDALIVLSAGLTIFWFVTMLPFVLIITPPLLAVVNKAFPSIVSPEIKEAGIKPVPKRLLGTSMLAPGVIMILIGLTISFTPLNSYMSTNIVASYLPITTLNMIQLLLYAGGTVLTVLGAVLFVKKSNVT